MPNIIATLTARIEAARAENAKPCKSYATEARAEAAVAECAKACGHHFDSTNEEARYVVFYVASWGRWVGAVDMTEILRRPTSMGGYVGLAGSMGFFCF